ncbi:MAG: DeoR/GlpR family DNA-binding transcription regulator [Clostridia bacterium]|nr:DeoR/GlpR family DNA-binding transcription regulator [Clostridia bacterium]
MKDRILQIKEYIDKKGKITLHELECAFPKVSSMTLRRDLNQLEEQDMIIRISGGAISVNTVLRAKEEDFSERSTFNAQEKIEIAEKAVSLLEPDSCIFIDSGSTTTYFARALPDENFYVLTNAMTIAETILRKEKPKVAFLGGDLRRHNFITVGSSCLNFIDNVNVQTAVMTATGFVSETGSFTCGMQSEAEVKQKIIEKADYVIMLVDSSKVNKKSTYTFATLKNIDCMVVDKNFPKDLKEKIEKDGVKVY